MERIILPYGTATQPTTIRPTPSAVPATPAYEPDAYRSAKGAAAYLGALRKRFWLALLVASLMTVGGSIAVLRQKPVFRATAQIEIEPPHFDAILTNLVSEQGEATLDPDSAASYESNRLAQLRNRSLVERVLVDPSLGALPPGGGDLAVELVENLQTTQLPRTTRYDVNLEGRDPAWIAKVLNVWLDRFQSDAKDEVQDKVDNSKEQALASMRTLEGELRTLQGRIAGMLKQSPILSPDGENMLLRHFDLLGAQRLTMASRQDEMLRSVRLSQMFPEREAGRSMSREEQDLEQLDDQRQYWLKLLDEAKRKIVRKKWLSDPHIKYIQNQLRDVQAEMDELKNYTASMSIGGATPEVSDPFAYLLEQSNAELAALKEQEDKVFNEVKEMAPQHNEFLMLLDDQERKSASLAELGDRIRNFSLVATTQNDPVKIVSRAVEPTKPVRPNRAIQLALVFLVSLASGAGLVMLVEHVDHSVRAPEQASAQLSLPLLGVVPKMRRTARLQRGGHLWTPAVPHSVEADAYRNLRASLVGTTGAGGQPLVALLVTSAKPGEGKSTTALNLAATCARSGERTLLMDVDLRRPSLRGVFDDGEHDLGLVDVLRGDLPWQRTVIQTDIPNLDFLPTGDPAGIPVEILGALELRQLIIALTQHYDRVILDGPAILGLADCRMLGRVVDAAALVVRAGAHDLRPIQRAKQTLDQSGVHLAGVVFNGLLDDVANWSSYASHEYAVEGETFGPSLTAGREPAAAAAIGS